MISIAFAALVTSFAPTAIAPDTLPCNVPLAETWGENWRLVRGKGFTFCIPESWKPVGKPRKDFDQDTWRNGMSTLNWKIGPAPRRLANAVATVSGQQVIGMGPSGMRGTPPSSSPSPDQRDTEIIGDREVKTWTQRDGNTWRFGAAWNNPLFYFTGEARDPRQSQIIPAIYQTVRIAD